MDEPCIPTVDLSTFLREDEEYGKNKAKETITKACSEYGFFQIVNHGVSLDLMKGALELSKTFFDYPDEEKNKSSPSPNAPLPAGYNKQPLHSPDKNEYLLVFPPRSDFNVYPENPPHFREVLEELFGQMSKIGVLMENIINECLGLPPNFLKEFNHDRSWDFMVALRYFPVSANENVGITEHEDGNCITFVLQDGVGGLEVLKNGDWIPVVPAEGTIVVNVGDVIQIFKYLSSLEVEDHKDVKSGYSITFNFNPNPYFEDTKLVKTFTFHEEGTTKITATPIKWKEGKGIPNGVSHEKKGNKRAPTDISFFSWFSDTEQKDDMDDIHDEVAELIKDDLWPNPLTYFNNEDPDEADVDEDEADDEGKDDDDSDDDDDQDDDEGEDE